MVIERKKVRELLNNFNFQQIFVEYMGWSYPPSEKIEKINIDGVGFDRKPIAQLSGVWVYEVSPIPNAETRRKIYEATKRLAHENLLIFKDKQIDTTQSLWYWVKRDGEKKQPREHIYLKNQASDLFLNKLDSLVVEMDEFREDGTVPLAKVTTKLASSLDIERVTKQFYTEFSKLRLEFIELIDGISKESDRFWYASVLLNRLMFIFFMQKQGFIQGRKDYLEKKLENSKKQGVNRYYHEFLSPLFFEGFALPENERSPETTALLGDIKYLNGGLFLKHQLELNESYHIQIPDIAFENVFTLFNHYSWYLDDTPGAKENEINPDVLGYIFEKYINQKAFGAYYTRPEITQYLCERTIHAVIVEKINEKSHRKYENLGDILLKLDAELCKILLNVLSSISILDPACGSGAFLVAAMKTLLNIYAYVFGKINFLKDDYLSNLLRDIEENHPSIDYYSRKRIITDNLYGVDIMPEAAEIARLRLFLFLVSSAKTVDQLEPLPNIDFNIMQGNSLIGLLTVDEKRFDGKQVNPNTGEKQQVMFGDDSAKKYRALLDEKNRLIRDYKGTAENVQEALDLQGLRDAIDKAKDNAYTVLSEILRDDFATLGIKYEEIQVSGKAKKRPVELADIERLEPFHWGYEFDEIMGRGGFDIIIANPPWEIFKPQAKEFFADYSDVVTKNKMDIKTFEAEQDKLLQTAEIAKAWTEYQSRFPHVSAYYRSASQFKNQISVVNGKKAGTDINLYKLFTEQCFNLMRNAGQVGIVIPSGIYTDLGTKQLREMLFAQTRITGLFGFENRKTIFEGVDSRFKFVVMTFLKGGTTQSFPAAFMRLEVSELENFPNADSFQMNVAAIRKLAPDSLSIPEFKGVLDAEIAEKISRFPLLGEELEGSWQISFSAEFHMTNDSRLFKQSLAHGRLPLYEGKMIWQFDSNYAKPRYWVDANEGRKAVLGARGKDTGQDLDYQTYRLAFRDIASSTNERTLVSSIIPPTFHGNKIPTMIVFDAKGNRLIDNSTQLYLCSVWNSFVLDYLIRQRVTTTLNFFYLYQLPIPRLISGESFFNALVERAAKLICTTPEFDDLAKEVGLGSHKAGVKDEEGRAKLRAEIDGMVAHLYGLSEVEFAYILDCFPAVNPSVKAAALEEYRKIIPPPPPEPSEAIILGESLDKLVSQIEDEEIREEIITGLKILPTDADSGVFKASKMFEEMCKRYYLTLVSKQLLYLTDGSLIPMPPKNKTLNLNVMLDQLLSNKQLTEGSGLTILRVERNAGGHGLRSKESKAELAFTAEIYIRWYIYYILLFDERISILDKKS